MTFKDLPEDVRKDMMITAREIHGSGYTPDYYRQIAANWVWVYEFGVEVGRHAELVRAARRLGVDAAALAPKTKRGSIKRRKQ